MFARVAMPAVRQKRSKLAPTSCQASSMVATGTTAADVVGSFMALLSFVDSAPRAYRLKVGNACPPISTSNGTSPATFCDARSHPVIREFVRATVEWENSLNCAKIERILGTFDRKIWESLKSAMTNEEIAAIDSLKALRDQIAHGKDNNTGYFVIARYFEAIADFPEKLS